jgi:aspartate/methionine/tyrosine aminotransferase
VTLEGLRPVPYRLELDDGWQPDLPALAGHPARAVIAVHPNNPTGSFLSRETARALAGACASAPRALVADEVFLDYELDDGIGVRSFAGATDGLRFCLGGLSKLVGLPQLKLSWIAVCGPADEARRALDGLAFIADQYLSVSTPVQLALPRLLERGAEVRAAIRARCRRNLDSLSRAATPAESVTVLRPQAGWCATVRAPAVRDDEAVAVELLREDGVAVHPGFLFDFPGEGFFVLSLLPEPAVFDAGVERTLARLRDG